jgi:hypothetical protein
MQVMRENEGYKHKCRLAQKTRFWRQNLVFPGKMAMDLCS